MPTSRDLLTKLFTHTDNLTISAKGDLWIEGCRAADLAVRYGSPLYVLSEGTFRQNLRRVRAAFQQSWPAPVQILFALKANTNVAIRAIAHEEGVGSDCNSIGELEMTFLGGAASRLVTLNGSNKQPHEMRRAMALGALIILDAESEVDLFEAMAAELGIKARACIRMNAVAENFFDDFKSDAYPQPGNYNDSLRRRKWGVSKEAAIRMVQRLQRSPHISLEGYHMHLGRMSRDVKLFAANHGLLAELVVSIHEATGFLPKILNIGGGWPRERDPEARVKDLNPVTIERYAVDTCAALRAPFERDDLALPELWLEPGRYVAGNAGIFLTTVGVVKRDRNMIWVNIDASGEWMMLVQNLGSVNHITPVTGMDRPADLVADVMGPTCVNALFSKDCALPQVIRGEVLAILDAGAYAESMASQFNSMPRPATVLVRGQEAELIRRRETLDDVFATQIIPDRFRKSLSTA